MTTAAPRMDRPPPPAAPPRRQWLILGVVAALALAAFLLGPPIVRWLTPAAPPPPPAPPAGTFQATAEQWRTLTFAQARRTDFLPSDAMEGQVAADDTRTSQVFSPYTGRVTRIFAQAGDRVRAGQPLFAVAAAEYVQAQSDLITAAAQVRLTRAALERQQALLAANGAATKDVEQAQADAAAAKASLEAAQNRLRVLGASPQDVARTEARASASGISPDVVVPAPIGGVVTQRSLGVGQNLASLASNGGATPAFVISDLSHVWLLGQLREDDAAKARVGQSARVTATALPGRSWTGRVEFVSPVVDPASRRIAVRISVANPDGALKPQMFVTFDLFTGAAESAIAVPAEAVLYEGDRARVWVAGRNRLLSLREVQAGRTQGGLVQILSGLAEGETVVASGSIFIDRASKGD